MKHTRQSLQRRARLAALAETLPGAAVTGEQHLKFEIAKRTFAYYQFDHHGDGMAALVVKAPPGVLGHLIASGPERFFRPGYLGTRGWVGLRLDRRTVDWGEVEGLLRTAHALAAPRRPRRP